MSLEALSKDLNKKAVLVLVSVLATGIGSYFFTVQLNPETIFLPYFSTFGSMVAGIGFWAVVVNTRIKKEIKGNSK